MDTKEIRLLRLGELLAEHNHVKAALAKTIGKAPAQVSQWFAGFRTITEETAREIERKAKKPRMWMDSAPESIPSAHRVEEPPPNYSGLAWPFDRIDYHAVQRMNPEQLDHMQTGMLLLAAQLGLKIGKRAGA